MLIDSEDRTGIVDQFRRECNHEETYKDQWKYEEIGKGILLKEDLIELFGDSFSSIR